MSFSSDLDFKRFTLGFLLDWKQGGDIINLTEFLYDAGQNQRRLPRGRRRRGTALDTFNAGMTQVYVQDGSYLKLREVTLAYNLPESFTRRLFGSTVRYARLSAERPEPAPLHRLPRARSRGEQLRQPGHRAEHRRGPVPAEPQLLLLDRLGF